MWMRIGLFVLFLLLVVLTYSFSLDGDSSAPSGYPLAGSEDSAEGQASVYAEHPANSQEEDVVGTDGEEHDDGPGSMGPSAGVEDPGILGLAPEFGQADVYFAAPEEGVPQLEGPAPGAFDSGTPGPAPEASDSGTAGPDPEGG